MSTTAAATPAGPAVGRVVLASVVGTTIEFYDFYVYGIAAALVIGPVFFPSAVAGSQSLNAFLTFGIAFLARPFGSALFGHYGDRIGRKSTLVASLLCMGVSTTLIGFLPGYAAIGAAAPMLLCLMRMGQGIGLGGEWGGAALLATENAPAGRRGWFGMFPQLGPPFGFLAANGLFLLLSSSLTEAQFTGWGWRVPFLASAVLVVLGLYVRLNLTETPAFARAVARDRARGVRRGVPLMELLRHHLGAVALGSLAMVVCYALFYISTVFALGYAVGTRHIPRHDVLLLLCVAILAMAATTPVAGVLADRFGRRPVLLGAAVLTGISGFLIGPLLGEGGQGAVLLFLAIELGLMGLTFAPMGALLPELFPTRVRYTGASAAYNIGGILGGSLAPYAAQRLVAAGGLPWVGYYITGAAAVSFLAILCLRETAEEPLIEE